MYKTLLKLAEKYIKKYVKSSESWENDPRLFSIYDPNIYYNKEKSKKEKWFKYSPRVSFF